MNQFDINGAVSPVLSGYQLNGTGTTTVSGTGSVYVKNLANGTMTVRVQCLAAASNNANLSGFSISRGTLSPSFSSGTISYTASVAYSVSSMTVTPTLWDSNATVTVNGNTVNSGAASGSLSLNEGANTITTVVTAENGTTTKTYTLTVTRAPAPNPNLSALSLSQGTLSPTFSGSTTSYSASVANAVDSLRVTPTLADSNATVTVNGHAVTSGAQSSDIALAVGNNTITVLVTAYDGTTTKSYEISVRRLSNDASLSSLVASEGTLSPAFSGGTTSYTLSVANPVTSVTFTPTVNESHATVTVNGNTVTSGQASGSISLSVGSNSVSIVVTAEDASTTTYTVSANRAPPLIAGTLNETVLQNSSSNTFTPTITGGTATSLAIDSGPSHGTASVSGMTLTYTPGVGYTGSDSFTYTASNDDGSSQPGTVTITVEAVPTLFTPASGALPQAMAGEAYTGGITTTANPDNTPIFSVSAGALPPGMILNVSTGELSGPLAANSEGNYSFTISVEDSLGFEGSAAYTLEVIERAITVSDKTESVPAGEAPPSVYLNNGATGGPFDDSELVSVEPADAGTAKIIRGELAQTVVTGPFGFYLKFTPNHGFKGQAKVGFKLISALGTSNMGVVTYNVAFDPEGTAADIDRRVHGFVQARQNLIASNVKTPGLIERRRMAKATEAGETRVSPNGDGVTLGVSTSLAEMRAAKNGGKGGGAVQPFNVWVDGTLMAHRRDESDDNWGSFGLVSVGADYLLSPRALVGVSLHVDRMTDPTDQEAELVGTGWLAGPYASFEIGEGVFFDTNLLYGGSSNDIDTLFFDGSFDTSRWMWTAKIAGQWNLDDVTITPRLKAVYLSEEVDDYTVGNDNGDKLILPGFTTEQFRISVGADLEKQVLLESGLVLKPSLGFTAGAASLDNEGLFGALTTGLALSDNMSWEIDAKLLFNLETEGQVGVGGKLGGNLRF
ncbi:cadherin-like beta sandwich domain-containing protein [Hyphomicrobium sp. LHD-15]|uniref:cadherin-like beta sandwich domain-containing protein n=1 Tax=Hyphomicrobium sp. LHD-15 TaxID=3072142 RepID=UPI00280E197B|nr:cadherin-like beta sandwich domain-containing protein [Hyphomicrobium sp. LHD-15]MDQ8698722.1 cadherin-like beta sandwich domain-containing protein [Hyphomicrobium sp. LHD-15]